MRRTYAEGPQPGLPYRAPKTRAVKPPKPVTFEQALKWLRAGKAIRRRSWHRASLIFRLKDCVYVQLPGREPDLDTVGTDYRRAPDVWRPYPADFLATDWEKA